MFRKVRDLSPSKRKAEMEKIQVSNGSFFFFSKYSDSQKITYEYMFARWEMLIK